MPFFVAIAVFFVLAALGIWFYFTQTKAGRAQNVYSDLDEAQLQNKFMDSIEETHAIQNELSARLDSLKTK